MKRLICFLAFALAFVGNALAQWNQDSKIRETHWFGQYEYLDQLSYLEEKNINWSGNYIQSIEIVKTNTGQYPVQRPKTSFYSWLDHQLRFSVDNTSSWTIDASNNSAYSAAFGGQGLKNSTWQNQDFHIHNLQSGDEYTITYYENGGNQATTVTGSATGTATVSIPGQAVIRCVEIQLGEYVASDFKVEEVSGQDVSSLTSSHNSFLSSQGVSAQFGDLGYRYSFKGPGVLEDKRGAAPYITMKFGNDNDMTFVRTLADVTYSYGSLKQVTPMMFTKNGGQTDEDIVASTPDGNGVYVVQSMDNPAAEWDTQFWIGTTEYNLPAGQKFKIKFDYMADAAATVHTQTHGGNHGPYIHWACIGDLNFTTEWQPFEQEITIDNDMSGWQSVAFNLNVLTSANKYYFKNITIEIPERTENISDEDFGAASIIHESNDLNPYNEHLQYRWTFKDSNFGNRFSEAEIRDRMEGKEWSTFTAKHPTSSSSGVHPDSNGEYVNGVNYIYGDEFSTIWPLCGNFFYFFPEVDGLLEIDYYCEGSNETNAFWYKQDAAGNLLTVDDQPKVQFINANGQNIGNRTDGTNNYKMMVNVEKGGIYYLCSLPTNISHERPIFRLKSYIFIPRFRVAPLYKVVHNTEVNTTATQKVAEIVGGPYTDLNGGQPGGYGNNSYELTGNFTRNAEPEARVKCLGNVASAKAYVEWDGSKQWLSFSDIKFKEGANVNPGGAIVAHVNNDMGQASFVLTIAYDAADAKWNDDKTQRVAATTGGKEVKFWDFYSSKDWDLGQYGSDDGTRYATNPNGWKAKSKLFKEVHKADGLTADWEFDYVDVPNQKEPLYKSIYDMEADNADMIHETAGLVFFTEPNELGIWNENGVSSTTSFQDRFIGLMGGGKLIVPFLKENDRVVIKMGCFGNADNNDTTQPATLTFTNAKDALGTAITGDYKIGGSGVKVKNGLESEGFDDLSKPYGEYHFISTGGDFTLQVKEADLLKIYSIAIYRNAANDNADILTENSVAAEDDKRYILNVPENDAKDHAYLHINYRGENEPTKFHQESRKTGNITAEDIEPDTGAPANDEWYNYSVNRGKFGVFKSRLGVKTTDEAYVTDYADCMIPVGYRETLEYPYTWDFTDLKKYVSAGIDTDGTEKEVDEDDLKIWDEYGFRTNSEEYDGYIFAPGGQLYGGTTMFDETRGIGIFHNEIDNKSMTMNGSADAADGGLAVSDEFGFVVPQVEAGQAVYVHTTGNGTSAQYAIGNGTKQDLTAVGTNAFAMKMADDATKANVTLYFKGYEVNKIAVSGYSKTVNKLGFASESRDEEIDPELMSYMTGTSLKAYTVTEVNYGTKAGDIPSIKLEAVPTTNVIAASTTGDNNAYIIYNPEKKAVDAINEGFHLFVPDMHDKSTADNALKSTLSTTNYLKSWYPEGSESSVSIPQEDGNYTNYLMNYKYKDARGKNQEGPEAFYRAGSGATLGGNKAYLQLLTKNVKPASLSVSNAKFVIFFVDEEEGTETTSIDGIQTTESLSGDNSVYTLSGMKVSKPQKGSIYVKNGKKIVIK